MATTHQRCNRCRRRLRNNREGWNAVLERGVIVGILCPQCQTPEENAEAEIKEATLDYSTDHAGRVRGRPKGDKVALDAKAEAVLRRIIESGKAEPCLEVIDRNGTIIDVISLREADQ